MKGVTIYRQRRRRLRTRKRFFSYQRSGNCFYGGVTGFQPAPPFVIQ